MIIKFKCASDLQLRCQVQQAGLPLTDLDPNIEYTLILTIYNGIITHSSQHVIRIYCCVPNLTLVRGTVDLCPMCPILHGSSERMVQQY